MPDPIVTALIAGVSAIIGGFIAAIGRPWGQDWVARGAEERAAKRASEADYKMRVERVGQLLAAASVEGPHTATAEREWRELPTAASAVNDQALTNAVDQMWASPRSSPAWGAAQVEASKRVGQLLSSR